MPTTAIDLYDLAHAADPNVSGTSVLDPVSNQPGWYVVTRADGMRVRLDTANGNPPLQAATDAILNADLSDPAVAGRNTQRLQTQSNQLFLAAENSATRDRAIVLVAIDEINLLRDWITQFKAAVAAATTLADLKTRVAALANVPQRTPAQAKAAVMGKITTGGAD